MSPEQLKAAVSEIVPSLSSDKSKGQAGKIATIGGCREYTGAPFFASYSALKVGSDLSHVFCTEGAATVIKSYSPELIVHPYLADSHDLSEEASTSGKKREEAVDGAVGAIEHWLERFDVVVVGPGLGRDELVHDTVVKVFRLMREKQLPMVIDADGLYIVTKNLDLVKGYPHAILTPNKNEYQRLASALDIDIEQEGHLEKIAKALDGPTLVRKGAVDGITNGTTTLHCDAAGSKRRAGGQGDVLSGSIAAFMSWAVNYGETHGLKEASQYPGGLPPTLLAAYGGCLTARHAAKAAYAKKRRSMVAGDVIEELGDAVDSLFDQGNA
ncbi:ATP-dependent (S)-NAD(P)H-hydrate dehydratase [Coccomyxa sp. Obi]|nr:ATP-dependent (S)-NAD(P)H-hydrate dehydratase [Coccomyxa sp. Obi]